MRQYTQQYVARLPNFLCIQVTQQFQAPRKPSHWRRGDTLTARLVFREGREERSLELVNGKPWNRPLAPTRTPLETEGEFGAMLDQVLGAHANAAFKWKGWDVVQGRRVGVFDYAVDRGHSSLRLSLADFKGDVLPYFGSVFADPETGDVWRITESVTGIPPELMTRSISRSVTYDKFRIGDSPYLLPAEASVLLDTGTRYIRNEIQFRMYQKFETVSKITYGPARTGAH